MKNNFDLLIDLNLKLIYDSDGVFMKQELKAEDGTVLRGERDILIRLMQEHNLISLTVSRCDLTAKGIKVSESGGWLNYIKKETEIVSSKELKELEKEKLEFNKLKLEIDDLRNKINDYGFNKRNSKVAIWVSIGSVIISLVTLIFK